MDNMIVFVSSCLSGELEPVHPAGIGSAAAVGADLGVSCLVARTILPDYDMHYYKNACSECVHVITIDIPI